MNSLNAVCLETQNIAFTGTRCRRATCSMVSNDGALMPRSIRLRKSTEIATNSANRS